MKLIGMDSALSRNEGSRVVGFGFGVRLTGEPNDWVRYLSTISKTRTLGTLVQTGCSPKKMSGFR